MEQKYYTCERNAQILISLLKQHGINRVIASPGTTNMTFVGSIQQDQFFEIYSSVDERSAAYMACGMAAETGEPVVLSCTGATASRNYMPGLTEAFYRKLPVLAVTSHRGDYAIGHLIDQQIDRRVIPQDIAIEHVVLPLINSGHDEKYCIDEANKALLALQLQGGGPVHINLHTSYSLDFTIKTLPPARLIQRYTTYDVLPEIPKNKRVAVFVGAHKQFSEKEVESIDAFCATYDAVVFCDHTSHYYGKYAVHMSLPFCQRFYRSLLKDVDLLIHIGQVTGDGYKMSPQQVWRVGEDGALRDYFGCLTDIFMMPEQAFFNHYKISSIKSEGYLTCCNEEYARFVNNIPELPFGNIWIAQTISSKLPLNCSIHFGIYNSLRSWSFFELPKTVKGYCNVGGFGIDGGISTLLGAAIARPDKLFFGVFGDLAFFYDMNVLGNRDVSENIRILLINNGIGAEFKLSAHPCHIFGENANAYMAAGGHYGNKSKDLVRHYAQDLGFRYLTASNKEEFMLVIEDFLSIEKKTQPMLLEVFTNSQDESNALELITSMYADSLQLAHNKIKGIVRNLIGDAGAKAIRKIIK